MAAYEPVREPAELNIPPQPQVRVFVKKVLSLSKEVNDEILKLFRQMLAQDARTSHADPVERITYLQRNFRRPYKLHVRHKVFELLEAHFVAVLEE